MANQLTNNAEVLRLFFTDDVYLTGEEIHRPDAAPEAVMEAPEVPETPAAASPVKEAEIPRTFTFKGGNTKHILILVNDHEHEVSSEEGTVLLRNIVKSVGLTGNDFALVNYAACAPSALHELERFFKCRLVLAFGVEAAALGLPDYPLHELSLYEEIRILFSLNLHELHQDIAGKKALWASLQQLNY